MRRSSPSSAISVAFIALLAINALLWSNSRFAHPPLTRIQQQQQQQFSILQERACEPSKVPPDLRCDYAIHSCPEFISLQTFYCSPEASRPFIFSGLLLWLIFLFTTLGISASDFFCPNLASISNFLGLNHNVAGVTVLAFGNGSPDVFSTFSAMRAGSGSLAIGELIGAASFIVSVVAGSIAIIRPFRVPKAPFLRDVGFFTVAVAMLIVITHDGLIHTWEAASLVGLYVAYVITVVFGSFWGRQRERRRRRNLSIQEEYTDEGLASTPYRDEEPAEETPLLRRQMSLSVSVPNLRPEPGNSLESSRLRHSMGDMSHLQVNQGSPSHLPSFSLLGALEFRHVISSLQRDSAANALSSFDIPVSPFAAGHYRSHHPSLSPPRTPLTQSRYSEEADPWDVALGVPLDDRFDLSTNRALSESRVSLSKLQTPGITVETPSESTSPTPSEFMRGHSPLPSPSRSRRSSQSRRAKFTRIIIKVSDVIFPTLHGFRSQTVVGKAISLFAAPAVFALTITLPVVISSTDLPASHSIDSPAANGYLAEPPTLLAFEEEGVERPLTAEAVSEKEYHELHFNKWLTAVQCALGPLFCAFVLFKGQPNFPLIIGSTAIASFVVAALVALFADAGNDPAGRLARCFIGFFVAIVWIMAIADEVVTVLQTFGLIFGLSDAIIGLTIFAVGNSLADLIADISVASFAPVMAFSACIGGPMLNILLGVGGSGTYITGQTDSPFSLHFTTTLMVSSIGLLALLVATLLFVPYNDYWLTKRWGAFLIGCYGIIMILNIIVEAKNDGFKL